MAWTFQSAIIQSDLPANARLVALVLASHCNGNGDMIGTHPIQKIAKECGLSRNTVRTAIKTLEANRLIVRYEQYDEHGGRLADHYVLVWG